MNNVNTAINLAAVMNEPVENITFEVIRSSDDGAKLYSVCCGDPSEVRYVIEGETGEMLSPLECTEEEAVLVFEV
jgi:hypothetical protein